MRYVKMINAFEEMDLDLDKLIEEFDKIKPNSTPSKKLEILEEIHGGT